MAPRRDVGGRGRGPGDEPWLRGLDDRQMRMVEDRLADALGSAGWDGDRIATELLLLIPGRFRDAYTRLFAAALKDSDAGVGARGAQAEESGRVGRAGGMREGAGSDRQIALKGGAPKRYRNHWHIADPVALALKDKVDKRLRGLAREIEIALQDREQDLAGGDSGSGMGSDSGSGGGEGRAPCGGCGRFMAAGWKFCPECGGKRERKMSS